MRGATPAGAQDGFPDEVSPPSRPSRLERFEPVSMATKCSPAKRSGRDRGREREREREGEGLKLASASRPLSGQGTFDSSTTVASLNPPTPYLLTKL